MQENPLNYWKTLKSAELLNASPWIRHSVEQVKLPDGRVIEDYHQIELMDYAGVVAQTVDGKVIFERMYKHGVKKVCLTLPGGGINPNEDPLAAARRELLEETGYVAEDWQSLGTFVSDGNYGCGRANLFFARSAKQVTSPHSADLEDMEVVLLSLDEMQDCLSQGLFAILGAAAGVALALNAGLFDPPATRA